MVLRIRLARWGARNNPFYGIVVADSKAAGNGKHLERVGTYNPLPDSDRIKHVELNVERIKHWIGRGVLPTERAAWILAKANLMPLTPKQLQRQGSASMVDAKTWKVNISSSDGVVSYSPEQAREALKGTPEFQYLPATESTRPTPILKTLDIKLDGSPPRQPLTPSEILTTLQKFTGIKHGAWSQFS